MRRPTLLLALAAAAGVSGALAFGLPALVASAARSAAAERGFDVRIGAVALRPTRVWLHDVELRHGAVDGFTGKLDAIEVRFGLAGIRSLSIHGGEVRLRGDRQSLLRQFRALRGGAKESTGGSAGGKQLSASGLYLGWSERATQNVHVWGLSFRRGSGQLQLAADLLKARQSAAEVEMADVAVQATLPGLALKDVKAARTEVMLSLGDESPADVAGSGQGSPSTRGATDTAPSNNKSSASTPGALVGAGLGFSPGRGERLRARLEAFSGLLSRRLPVGGKLQLDGVHVIIRHDAQRLNLGPVRLSGVRDAQAMHFSFLPGANQGREQLQAEVVLPVETGPVKLSAHGGPIALSELGVREGDFGLAGVKRARLELRVDGELSSDGQLVKLASSGAVHNVSLDHAKLAPEPLTDIEFSWSGEGHLLLDGSKLVVPEAELSFGAVKAQGELSLERQDKRLVVDAKLEVPSASCQSMFDSLPSAVVPLLRGAKFRGDFSWKGSLLLDTDRPSDAKVGWRMNNRCHITHVPEEADPQRFTEPFSRGVPSPDGVPLIVWSGPGSADWVPLELISRYLEVAVLTTEDGGFWSHQGFDQGAIAGSIRQNLEAGRFVRGASTISMQLAKNLYLSRDKHVSRKIQEALLTMLLEQRLTKAQILELYLNVIEFGPDIWGIGMAADHYFHSEPADLSIAQCFFLAALLPSPLSRYFEDDGSLTASRWAYIRRLMKIAHDRSRLSAAELAEGLTQEVRRGVPHLTESEETDDDEELQGSWR